MMQVSVYVGWVFATLVVAVSSVAEAQFITRWVDANGVVTFSTSSPPPGVKYEPVYMPSRSSKRPADPVPGADSSTASPADPTDDGKKAENNGDKVGDGMQAGDEDKKAEAPAPSGPAQVTLQEQATASLGETRWLLSGKVKNDGGAVADGVAIRINVAEDGQGNPCLEDRGSVNPSTLKPGDIGTFELTYDSPCFFGSPQIDIVTEWQK